MTSSPGLLPPCAPRAQRHTISLIFLFCAFFGAMAPATQAAPAPGTLLAWHAAEAPAAPAGFIPLHTIATGTVGMIDPDLASRGLPSGTRVIGPLGDSALLLVTRATAAKVANGELPPAWSAALELARETGLGLSDPTPSELRAIPALVSDEAVVLLRLPSWLSVVADGPGCRAQRIDPSVPEPATALPEPEPVRTTNPILMNAIVRAVNSDRMMFDLDTLSTKLHTRSTTTNQYATAANYMLAQFQALGLSTTLDPFVVSGHTVNNVVAVKPGTTYPSRVIIISGHLDSTSPQAGTLAPGAEDNGTGAVAVLEAARLLANLPCENTIQFIVWAGEEQGLLGSTHYAAAAHAAGMDIRAHITMDMIGYYDPAGADLWIEGFHQGTSSVWLMNALKANAEAYCALTTYLYPSEGWGSDHVPFHSQGYSSILAIENEYDSYACYHQTCDTVDHLTPLLMRKIGGAVICTIADQAVVSAALGSIHGTVTIADGSSPAGANVSLAATLTPKVTVDASGQFTFADALPATYTVSVTKTGCNPATLTVTLPAGGSVDAPIVLQPLQPGSITGTVRDASGAPVADARVDVEGMTTGTVSAADGTYQVEGIAPGVVNVCATATTLCPRTRSVTISSGQNATGIDFSLEPTWDFEADSEGLTANAGWAWGIDTVVGAHSGAKVWGTVLGGDYVNCANYTLSLPPISLSRQATCTLRFWTWYKTEGGYDGGNLQASTDGGATWVRVPPEVGYSGVLAGSCNPLAGQQGYTGLAGTWQEKQFSLDSFIGHWVRLQLKFGSDTGTRDRGWYIDDLSILGQPAASGVSTPGLDGPSVAAVPSLRVAPNPARGTVGITLHLPSGQEGRCEVFAASGRRVAVLVQGALPAGERQLRWDGRDGSGHLATTGIYWAAWSGPAGTVRVPLVLLR